MRVECPECETSYTFKRCGIPEEECVATTICANCHQTIEVRVVQKEVKESWLTSLKTFKMPVVTKVLDVIPVIRVDLTRVNR